MKILSFCSKEVNNNLESQGLNLHKIGENGIIETLYYKEEIIDSLKTDISIKTLEEAKEIQDGVIFDFLSMLQNYYQINFKIFGETIMKDIKENNPNIKIKRISVEDKIEVLIEVLRVIMNRLLKCYHSSKIIILKLKFYENNENFKAYNEELTKIYEKIEREFPGLVFIEISEDGLESIEDIKNLDIKSKIYETIDEVIIFRKEQIHRSINNIKYVFEKAKISNTNKLIVIFSAFSIDIPKYNYVSFFKTIDCNKLFILDEYGEKGSYYLGLNGKFDIETSVMSLISTIMSENDINYKNVICIGSSKGGSAALYYGYKYGFGNVIAGAPQYKIGSYLIDLSVKSYAKDIFGDLSLKSRIKYDNLIRLVLNEKGITRAKILTSDGDHQYKKILRELEFENKTQGYGISFEKCKIDSHGEISKVFPDFLEKSLTNILEGKGMYINSSIFKIIKGIKKRGEQK